jgi:hypothetical protein
MKRKLILVVLVFSLLLGATGTALADVRLDFDVPWLLAAGLNLENITGSSSSVKVDLTNLHIPLPYVMLAYQFGDSFIRGGIGIRTYTVVIEFFGWPMAYVEASFDKLVLRAELGGGLCAVPVAAARRRGTARRTVLGVEQQYLGILRECPVHVRLPLEQARPLAGLLLDRQFSGEVGHGPPSDLHPFAGVLAEQLPASG